MALDLTEARLMVRLAANNAGDDVYGDDEVDRAIAFALTELIRRTGCNAVAATVASVADEAELDVSATLSDFTADALIRAERGYAALTVEAYPTLARRLVDSTAAAAPQRIAFRTPTAAVLFPTPDAAYDLRLTYTPPLTDFAPGTAAAVSLNVDPRYARGALWWGATAALQHTEVEHDYGRVSWRRFLEHCQDVSSRLSLAGGGVDLKDPDAYL